MIARFPIASVEPIFTSCSRYPDHSVTLANGNSVVLRWDESESADYRDHLGRWIPRPPSPGDTLIITEDGLRLAVKTETAWRWNLTH